MANWNLGRKIITLLFVLVLCFGLLSVATYATEQETPSEPIVTEPETTEAETSEAVVTEPETTEAETTEPETTEAETTEPETTEAETTEPESTEPEVTEPEITEPEVTEAETTVPTPTEPKPTVPAPEEIIETVTRPSTIPRPRPNEVVERVELPRYQVIHRYYTDSQIDGTVSGGSIYTNTPEEEVQPYTVYNGREYILVHTEVNSEYQSVILTYHRVVEIVYNDPVLETPEETEPEADIHNENAWSRGSSEDGLVEIPDEDVPLSDNPKTGDPIVLYVASTLLSGLGLAVVCFQKKKD